MYHLKQGTQEALNRPQSTLVCHNFAQQSSMLKISVFPVLMLLACNNHQVKWLGKTQLSRARAQNPFLLADLP